MTTHPQAKPIQEKLEEELKQHVVVGLFGPGGAGKSSLINALVGQKVAKVGVQTDVTVAEKDIIHNGLCFRDLPGFGTKAFPAEKFIAQFRVPDLDIVLAVTNRKFSEDEFNLFKRVLQEGQVVLLIRAMADMIYDDEKSQDELFQEIRVDFKKHLGTDRVFFVSTRRDNKMGLEELNAAIWAHLDKAKQDRWARGAKAYSQAFLDEKLAACRKHVWLAAGLSAANALVPVPGLPVALDIGILLKLFAEIREDFGLVAEQRGTMEKLLPTAQPMIQNIMKYTVMAGAEALIMALLKRYAGRTVIKEVSKYIPFVGQGVAAGIGFAITKIAGESYLEECHELASKLLEAELAATPGSKGH
jgi:GTP-binding protein EngB required for normal cell division/uncharacterized protein (DUF697 family)